MIPDPLHPAIVHFPIVLATVFPLFAVGALWAIRKGARARRAWALPVGVAVALVSSAWAAVETGEAQDERVERVVAEQPLSTHEEMAEVFLLGSAALLVVAAAGLVVGTAGRAARIATVVGSVLLVGGAARVGHSGGELVYRHGAAQAYATDAASARVSTRSGDHARGDDDER